MVRGLEYGDGFLENFWYDDGIKGCVGRIIVDLFIKLYDISIFDRCDIKMMDW